MYVTVNGQQVEDGKGNITQDNNQGKGILFNNKTRNNNHWIKIRLEGTISNRDGFGTLVSIKCNNEIQVQSLSSGQGYFSNNAQELYFGLGDKNIIDLIKVKWPSGIVETFESVTSNQTIYVLENKQLYQNTLTIRK